MREVVQQHHNIVVGALTVGGPGELGPAQKAALLERKCDR
jgi:hypothetical protein